MEVTSLAQPSPPGLILEIVIERVHFFFLLLLKGLCHEDMKILNKFHQRALTIIFWMSFTRIVLKLKRLAQLFQVPIHIHPSQQRTGNNFNAKNSLQKPNWTTIFGIQ